MVSLTDYAKEYNKKKKKNQTQNQTNGISAVAKASANQSFTAYAKSYNESKDSDIAPFKTVRQNIAMQKATSALVSATPKAIASAPTRTTKEQTTSAFDDAMIKKYSTMSLSDIEKELSRLEAEEKKFKEENGGKFINYLAKYGSYIGEGISGQNLSSARAKSDSNIDKIDDYTREKEILSIYRKQKATEEYLGGLDEKQLQLLDNIAKADDLDNAAPFVMATQQDNPMASYLYAQQTSPDKEIAKTSRETLYKQLQKKNPNKSDEEISELIDNMVELRKNQVNAERQEETETQLKELSSEHSIAAFLLSRGANLLGGPVGLSELWNQRNNEYGLDTNAAGFSLTKASTTIDEQIQLDHDWEIEVGGASVDAFDFFYKTGSGIVDNLGRFALSGGNTTAAGALMFTQGTTQSIISGKEKGYSDAKALTLGLLDGTFEAISEKISLDRILKSDGGVLKTLANSFAAEGSEELASNWLNRIAEQFANGKHSDLAKMYEAYINEGYTESQALAEVVLSVIGEDIESFLIGGLSGAVMGGGVAISNSKKANKLTEIEQKVFDKVVEDRIAEATEDGKKLTKAEEKKIREDVRRHLERGYIDTNTIESVLGGEEYETYKRLHDARTKYEQSVNDEIKALQEEHKKLQEEYKELNKLAMTEATLGDHNRQAEIKERQKEINAKIGEVKAELKELEADTSVSDLKARFDENFANVYKGSRLEESYRERLRANEDFQADFSKYKGTKYEDAARKTLENAVKIGINNTNRMRDFVEMNANYSARTGVVVNYSSNEQIKQRYIDRQTKRIAKLEKIPVEERTEEQIKDLAEMKEALEDVKSGKKKVNGMIESDGITINMDSANPLDFIAGHEITHSLEKAKSYDKLKKSLKAYLGESEYEKRFKETKETYTGTDAEIEKELVADLVGEYVFADYDFVKHLAATDQDIFHRAWDSIKHLYKMATAGSKEARQLEKAKRNFEKAWREGGKAESGTKLSIKKTSQMDYSSQLEMIENGKLNGSNSLYIGLPSSQLRNVGFSDAPFAMNQSDYRKSRRASAKNKNYSSHDVPYDFFENMPNYLADAPLLIDNGTKVSVITSYEMPDTKGNNSYVIAGVLKNQPMESDTINQVKSVYPLDDTITQITKAAEDGKLVYTNKNKAEQMLATIGIQPAEVSRILNLSKDILPQNSEKSSGKTKISAEAETKYNEAVKNNDIETAQKIVDEVAKSKGYTIKAYHGSRHEFNVFSKDKRGSNTKTEISKNWFFAADKETANSYYPYGVIKTLQGKEAAEKLKNKGKLYDLYIKMDNPLVVDVADYDYAAHRENADAWMEYVQQAEENGNDGIILLNALDNQLKTSARESTVYMFKDSSQAKSAEPITYDDNGGVIPLSERFNEGNDDIRYSLSTEQETYFKDSKVRDENGNLKVMYHGTSKGGHTVFDTYGSNYGLFGTGSYFTDNKSIAESYTNKGKGNNKQVYESYLNITNPLDMDAEGNAEEWAKAFPDVDFPESGTNEEFYRAVEEFYSDQMMPKWEAAEEIRDSIQFGMGYDGITHIGGGRVNADGERHQVYIAFEPEQIKNIDNIAPTKDADIRYSLSDIEDSAELPWENNAKDSEGNKLTQKQVDYFEGSQAVDRNGNLLKVYHTTKNDFTVFDKGRKGEATEDANTYLGFFFTDDAEYMQNFPEFENGKTESYYLDMKNPIDMTDISEEAFLDIVEVMGGDIDEAADVYAQELSDEQDRAKLRGDNNVSLTLGNLLNELTGEFYYDDFIRELKPHYDELMSKGYDGVINYMDELFGVKEYIVLDSNQAKLTSNKNPTADADVRYSITTEKTPQAKTRKTLKPTNSNLQKDVWSVRDVRNKTMLENNYTQADIDQVNKFMDNLATFMEKAGVTYKFIGLEDVNNAKVKIVYDRDGTPKRITMSAMVKNGEYPVNFDFTSICKKRQSMSMVIQELANRKNGDGTRALDEIELDAKALWTINEELRKAGLETACLGCFVESKRYNIQNFANKATTMWNSIVDEVRSEQGKTDSAENFNFAEGIDLDSVDYAKVDEIFKAYRTEKGRTSPENRMRALIKNGGEVYQKYLQPSDLMTPEGIEGLKSLSTTKNDFYGIIKGVYGQAAPKEVMGFSPYNSEIALLPDKIGKRNTAEYIASIGGVRMQSFSDFVVSNVYDYMQMVADLSAKHLPAHAYTKEIAFAKIFGMTGIKINMSVMFDIDASLPNEYAGLQFIPDANGDEVYQGVRGRFEYLVGDQKRSDKMLAETGERSYVQSIGFDEAVELQNTEGYSGNVGIIGVGFSDKHIRKMLNDNNIRYVIPYHSSSLPAVIKGVTNIAMARDYTDYQNTRTESGEALVGLGGFDIYKDVEKTKNPKQTAQNYLDYCKSKNYTPVFDMFADEENYYKVLFDFDPYDTITGEYSPQTEVKNIYKGYDASEGLTSTAEIEKLIDDEMKVQNEANRQRNAKLPSVVDSVLEQLGASNDKVGFSLSVEDRRFSPDRVYGRDALAKGRTADIAPMRETVAKAETVEDIAPTVAPSVMDEIAPTRQYGANTEQHSANILTEEPKVNKKKNKLWSEFMTNFVDKAHPFETLSLKTGNREVDAKYNSIRYSDTKAQNLIGKGTKGVKSLNDIRTEVEKDGLTKSLYEYLYHKHNVDRMTLENRYDDMPNKAVFSDFVTAETSQNIVEQYELAEPKLKEYAEDIYNYNRYLRSLLVEGGVISQETADLWEEMYPHYVPIRRAGDKGLNINVPLDTGRTGINAPIKQATGGNSDILPLFDTMAQRTLQTYKAIAKNRFGVELKNTLGTTVGSSQTNLDEVIDSIDAHDDLLQEGKNGRNPTFTVFENGEKVTFEITDEMYDAMKPTSKGLARTIKLPNKVSSYMRGVLTEYNPTFMLTNAIKDAQDVLLNSQHAARTYKNFPKAVTELLKGEKGKWYTEYMENGGADNTYFDKETNTFSKEKSTFAKVIGFPLEKISEANNFIEKIPRLAEYIASRESGRSVDVSMLDAARVTTNFAAGGDVTKFANRNGFTFLNASVQGAAQQVRNVREAKANGLKGWATLATKVALAGLPSILLNNLLWDDDEEYEELSDYVKQNYYVVAKTQDGKFVRIPKGRALAVIQSAFEQVQNAFTGDDEADWNSVLELAISNLAPNNPIDNNILAPIFQAVGNKTWYGEDLVPTRLQDLPAAEQYDESTDSLSKWLGEKINVSPYKINYLLNQYSGGIGDVVLPMLTPEAESGDNSLLGNLIAPLKDKFSTDSVLNNKNPSDFFSLSDELKVNANSSKATDEDKLKYKYINAVNGEISDLYKQKREIQNSNLSDELKYKQVRDLQAQINEMSRDALNAYENVKIDGSYANVGGIHFRLNDEGEWQKITDEQLEKQNDAMGILGITAGQYWGNKEEYDMAAFNPEIYEVLQQEGISVAEYKENYENFIHMRNDDFSWAANNPEKYTFSKAITDDVVAYREITSGLYEIRADKDSNGKTINGSAKKKKKAYIWNLDIDDGAKYILFKNEYNSVDDYNYEIIDYLNNRADISYEEMETILKQIGFEVDAYGNISW